MKRYQSIFALILSLGLITTGTAADDKKKKDAKPAAKKAAAPAGD